MNGEKNSKGEQIIIRNTHIEYIHINSIEIERIKTATIQQQQSNAYR